MEYNHKPHAESLPLLKKFCLTNSDCLGWDLDHTLIRYNLRNLYELIKKSFLNYLVEKSGYPRDVLKFELNFEIAKKGIILDRDQGNILQLDYTSRVVVGYHGTRKLTEEELIATYGAEKITGFSGSSTQRYWSLTTYFEAPLSSLYSSLVDFHDAHQNSHEVHIYYCDYRSHAEALYDALVYSFAEWGKGWYFPDIAIYPEKYIIKQPKVKQWLKDLKKKHNRFLFLLTNSLPEYTNILMNYSFGTDWVSLFDIVSVHAQKPLWFTGSNPYFRFEFKPRKYAEYPGPSDPTVSEVNRLELNGLYESGNAKNLIEFFSQVKKGHNGKVDEPLQVVYFGDHLRNDVQISKTFLNWNTVAIIEELEDLEIELGHPSSKNLVKGKTNTSHTSDNNYWANEAAEHADLWIPTLERLADFPCNHVFSEKDTPSVNFKALVKRRN